MIALYITLPSGCTHRLSSLLILKCTVLTTSASYRGNGRKLLERIQGKERRRVLFNFFFFWAKGAVVLPFWQSRGWILFYFTLPLQYGQISCVPWFTETCHMWRTTVLSQGYQGCIIPLIINVNKQNQF